MDVHRTIEGLRDALESHRCNGETIGLVPTMGALHGGHLSLIEAAHAECDVVVVSIFVNPRQFGPGEDYAKYPREEEHDLALCEQAGVKYVFAPSAEAMYPPDARTTVRVEELSSGLCGASRPGHFDGVCTVVAKLFNIVATQRAYFGHKDFQQAVVVRRMAQDLDFEIEIRVCPTVRDADGLAKSSRNTYLSSEERTAALAINRGLDAACRAFEDGLRTASALRATALEILRREPALRLEYLEVVGAQNALPVDEAGPADVIACAAWVGGTRLIDNMVLGADEV